MSGKVVKIDWGGKSYTCDACNTVTPYEQCGHSIPFGDPYCKTCGRDVHNFDSIQEFGRKMAQEREAKVLGIILGETS